MLARSLNELKCTAHQAEAPTEVREISAMLLRLEGAISDTQEAFATLGKRLGSVRMAAPVNAADSAQQLSASSLIGRQLAESVNRLKAVTDAVNELTDELAI